MKNEIIVTLTLTLISSMVFFSGCAGAGDNSSTGRYVVLEEVKQDSARIIEGPQFPPLFWNDATPEPVYFDQPGRYGVTVNRNLRILYFSYYSLYGPYRNVTSVRGIYDFPYRLESGVTVLGVDDNGTVRMSYGNASFTLERGGHWESPVVSSQVADVRGYNGTPMKVEFVTYWWIYNEPEPFGK